MGLDIEGFAIDLTGVQIPYPPSLFFKKSPKNSFVEVPENIGFR